MISVLLFTVIGLGGFSWFSHRTPRQQTPFPSPSAEGGASKEMLRDDWLPGVGNVVTGVGQRTPGNDWLSRDPRLDRLRGIRGEDSYESGRQGDRARGGFDADLRVRPRPGLGCLESL